MDYLIHILILIAIYAILTMSLDLVVGHSGLVSLAHGAFFGVGSYVTALLSTDAGAPFPLGAIAGVAVAFGVATAVGFAAFRLKGDYFAIATLGFQMIASSCFNNWIEVTRGSLGVAGIPRPAVFGWTAASQYSFLVLTATTAVAVFAFVGCVARSPFGRILRAIREDETIAQALGKNTFRVKLAVFSTSAAFAGLAGALYAHYFSYIDPSSFSISESMLLLSMVIIGGTGTRCGPIIGASLLVLVPEMLRFVGLPSSIAADFRQILYGSILIVLMIARPRGLVGQYDFGQ